MYIYIRVCVCVCVCACVCVCVCTYIWYIYIRLTAAFRYRNRILLLPKYMYIQSTVLLWKIQTNWEKMKIRYYKSVNFNTNWERREYRYKSVNFIASFAMVHVISNICKRLAFVARCFLPSGFAALITFFQYYKITIH